MNGKFGHYAPWCLAVILSALVVVAQVGTLLPDLLGAMPWPPLVMTGVVGYLGYTLFTHNRRLCERCVAAMPLHAEKAAGRYRFRFRVAHLFDRRVFAAGYLVTVIATSAVYWHPVGRVAWGVSAMSLVYLLVVLTTHQRLQPWCPRCRHGGQEVTAPAGPKPVAQGV